MPRGGSRRRVFGLCVLGLWPAGDTGIDPPSVWGLSSVGRAPALQAGCQRFESVRLHHYTSIRFDRKAFGFPVQSDAASSEAFTSFREIISVVGCTRVWVQQGQSFGIGSNDNVVQVKYTNQNVQFLHGNWAESLFRKEKAGNVHAFDRKRPPRAAKGRGCMTSWVFLLPDQIKRDKGVWWMPWQ